MAGAKRRMLKRSAEYALECLSEMAPGRKKSKLANENAPEQPPATAATDDAQSNTNRPTDAAVSKQQEPPAPIDTSVAVREGTNSQANTPSRPSPQNNNNRGSWYSSASWKSKASPVAQVARESISVDKGVSSESSNHDRRPSQSVSKSFRGGSRKSIPLVAEATRVHATSDVSQPPKQQRKPHTTDEKGKAGQVSGDETKEPDDAPLPPDPAMGDGEPKEETASVRPASGIWFGWWSRPDGYGSDTERVKGNPTVVVDGVAEEASGTPLPKSPDDGQLGNDGTTQQPDPNEAEDPSGQLKPEMSMNTGSTRSWFGLWSSTQNQQAEEEERQRKEDEAKKQNQEQAERLPQPDTAITAESGDTANDMKAADQPQPKDSKQDEERPKSAGWVFWSKEKPKEAVPEPGETQKEVGEIAVADTPSQSHPEAAQFNQEQEQRKAAKPELKRSGSLLRPKRGRPEKPRDSSGETTAAPTPAGSQFQSPSVSQFQTPNETPEASPAPVQRGKKAQQTRPNIVLPKFRDTYPTAPNPGYIERITQYFAETLHLPGYAPIPPPAHSYITPHPPKVRKAIAIGVHGYFPAQVFQRLIGQPTGTSIRFANYAATSIKQWCQEHQPDVKDVEVEKVALEGEGHIGDRVNTLWKLLLNWLSHLRQADFIFVACHSQGVPVGIMLIAKLIQLGALSPHVRIGVCAMAGVNLGPFLEYKSKLGLFGGSALELFDFCDSKSKVSIAYAESLDICLRQGVRVTFAGSIDDQLVSLESSLHTPLSHPYVNRIVFIDGRLHTSNFLSHLIIFAAKLRNRGVSDHGLLREISGPVAGSLVGGEGHSRVYDDPAVYQNALEFALESSEVSPAAFILPANPDEQRKSMEAMTQRRASLGGFPSNMNAANHMRRGSLSSLSLAPPGIPPAIAPYEAPGTIGLEKNPFVLPWAVRGMLEEDLVRRDPQLQEEVIELVKEFESWRPVSKVLKDVRWRLEGVRSML